jgi:hypothetical protein
MFADHPAYIIKGAFFCQPTCWLLLPLVALIYEGVFYFPTKTVRLK